MMEQAVQTQQSDARHREAEPPLREVIQLKTHCPIRKGILSRTVGFVY